MSVNLYIFNPDHDLALANGDENFNSPQSARTFAKDLACFPMWYAEANSAVLGAMPYRDWMVEMRQIFPQLLNLTVSSNPDLSVISSVYPWGWNAAVRKNLLLRNVDEQRLPSIAQLFEIRQLSHRETAIRAMHFLQEDVSIKELIPQPATLFETENVEEFVKQHSLIVFKAPWSSSGKGLCWVNGSISDSILGWIRNIIEKQDAVVAEKIYDKVQDFAMEFLCKGGKVTFAGYSLFQTERGVYKSNELASDDAIFETLTREWISTEVLLSIQSRMKIFIEQKIAPKYSGYLGVDMFVYQQDNRFMVHPCVEINLRMTMGMVARIFFDRFVDEQCKGRFFIDHYPQIGELLADHVLRKISNPLRLENGRIQQGYLSLSPISKSSHYRARVEIG
ncbi:MAG: hypothetical protein PHV20_14540 [Bacteroidales bacterium]|nr:hypothetical protein [Bacteroidales bacterium]